MRPLLFWGQPEPGTRGLASPPGMACYPSRSSRGGCWRGCQGGWRCPGACGRRPPPRPRRSGFIGGMDIPLIHNFACGYLQGARHVDRAIGYIENRPGTTPPAWTDPARGGALARTQFDRGVDVVFVAAGGTNLGVLQAA